MTRKCNLNHRLIVCVLLTSLFLQSCGGFSNQVIPQEKEQSSRTLKLSNNPLFNTDKNFVTSGSYLASFYEDDGELKANLRADEKQPEPNYQGIPVVVEEGTDLANFTQLDPITQQNRIQPIRKNRKIDRVVILNGEVAGGGHKGKERRLKLQNLMKLAKDQNLEAMSKLVEIRAKLGVSRKARSDVDTYISKIKDLIKEGKDEKTLDQLNEILESVENHDSDENPKKTDEKVHEAEEEEPSPKKKQAPTTPTTPRRSRRILKRRSIEINRGRQASDEENEKEDTPKRTDEVPIVNTMHTPATPQNIGLHDLYRAVASGDILTIQNLLNPAGVLAYSLLDDQVFQQLYRLANSNEVINLLTHHQYIHNTFQAHKQLCIAVVSNNTGAFKNCLNAYIKSFIDIPAPKPTVGMLSTVMQQINQSTKRKRETTSLGGEDESTLQQITPKKPRRDSAPDPRISNEEAEGQHKLQEKKRTPIKARQVVKILQENGFVYKKERSNNGHGKFYEHSDGRHTTIGQHYDDVIPPPTLRKIRKQTRLNF
ncbi:MAG: hypothetical protein BGO68_04915 [Candidatus Amoebophilus sp. 36-38]|nr:MAG: hypothetical protein BGO68_04915 [Candidatus Amoebophilus sp. 36-38]